MCFEPDKCDNGTCGNSSIDKSCNCRLEYFGVSSLKECTCPDGFLSDKDKCVDINECDDTNICINGDCINTIGSYTCVCNSGYGPANNENTKCSNINECLEGTHTCRFEYKCIDIEGSFECECKNQNGCKGIHLIRQLYF